MKDIFVDALVAQACDERAEAVERELAAAHRFGHEQPGIPWVWVVEAEPDAGTFVACGLSRVLPGPRFAMVCGADEATVERAASDAHPGMRRKVWRVKEDGRCGLGCVGQA